MKFAVAAAQKGRCAFSKKPICQWRITTQIDGTGAKEQAHEPEKRRQNVHTYFRPSSGRPGALPGRA